ncbi:MAG TPA: hypothetical protein PK413_05965 [Thermoanaerobaculia bacterium]|nr:hypothetical protein [Thermoanaerobaculia bacterium]
MLRYEHRSQPVASRRAFFRRVALHGGVTVAWLGFSLLVGTMGYCETESMSWLDGLLNASMILTGMGPVSPLRTTAGKLFASGYALYSGVVFVASAGLLVAPFLHRLMHKVHLDEDDVS